MCIDLDNYPCFQFQDSNFRLFYEDREEQGILIPDWLITSHVTEIPSSDWLLTGWAVRSRVTWFLIGRGGPGGTVELGLTVTW